jgi:membrane-bound metal-dependent hydrolase YbcI (DUF457 family)
LREIANTATISRLMPTPVGHALGGLAAAWFAESAAGRRSWPATIPLAIACAAVAMSPDLDILTGSHRTYTHSIAAVAVAGIIAWLIVRRRTRRAVAIALAIAAACASHLLLDWLGKDSSNPPGLMALWPFSSRFYISGVDLFGEVSRRYWKPEEFIVGNFQVVGRELVILIPIAAVAWFLRSRRTV